MTALCLQDGDKAGSTWEHILKAEDFKRRSFSDIDRNKDGFVDAKVRRTAQPLVTAVMRQSRQSRSSSSAVAPQLGRYRCAVMNPVVPAE